jgi:two-component system sensor histidine kinase TctE
MNASMSRIQSLIASQRRFIADASHQLRTPLTVLKTQSELAMREADRDGGDPAALRAMVHSIAATTDSAVHLANRLLMLARIEHSGGAEPAPVELRALVQQVALELALPAVSRNIDLALEAEHDVVLSGQALLLHELVANLVDNALRYTPAGGSVTLRVLPAAEGAGPILEVEDSGSGIPESERERVFSPFYRAAASMQRNPGGAGLGLAIVRDIAALHGAAIVLSEGARGQGLKVRVAFPASPVRSAA